VQETVHFALSGSAVSSEFKIQDNLMTCEFDKHQVGQVLDNLTINAQQAMPNGGQIKVTAENITFALDEHPEPAAGNYIRLSIEDHGIGIPKEFLPLIFDPYYTTKSKGHGLGLASCYSIIKKHEGCIDVISESGKGSTFQIYLPASNEVAKNDKQLKDESHKGHGLFLVMDDEEANRNIMKLRLESFGYEVVLTKNGQEAVDFCFEANKDGKKLAGMIFDLTIPGGMGGKEAIHNIREFCKDTPAFVASGYSSDPIMSEPEKFGFNASICKPFMSNELAKLLEKHLNKID
jgi:CheY-like chemotaxis protein